jgi:hypothetical protein
MFLKGVIQDCTERASGLIVQNAQIPLDVGIETVDRPPDSPV